MYYVTGSQSEHTSLDMDMLAYLQRLSNLEVKRSNMNFAFYLPVFHMITVTL